MRTLFETLKKAGLALAFFVCACAPAPETEDRVAPPAQIVSESRDARPIPSAPDYLLADGKAHFETRMAEIMALEPVQGGTLLLLGDSLTEGWLWQAAAQAKLPGPVVNHGIGWDTTTGLLLRLEWAFDNMPNHIFVLIGTNDISYGRSIAEMETEFRDLLSQLTVLRPGARVIVQSVLPREAEALDAVAVLNRMQRRVAGELGADYLDLTPAFAAPDGTLRPELTYDGLHLNDEGYEVWAAEISNFLSE